MLCYVGIYTYTMHKCSNMWLKLQKKKTLVNRNEKLVKHAPSESHWEAPVRLYITTSSRWKFMKSLPITKLI